MSFCTNCGGEFSGTEKFCASCGSAVGAGAVSPAPATSQSDPAETSGPGVVEDDNWECPRCGGHRFYPRMPGHDSRTSEIRHVCVECGVDAFLSTKGRNSLRPYLIFAVGAPVVAVVLGVAALVLL